MATLLKELRHGGRGERSHAAWALGQRPPPAPGVVAALVTALRDEYDFARERAAEALGDLGSYATEAVPALITAIDDPDGDAGTWAIGALGDIGPRASASIPRLVALLIQGPEGMREEAARSLGRIGPAAAVAVPALLRAWAQHGEREAIFAFGRIGPGASAAVPALIAVLEEEDAELCDDAAYALREIGPAASAAVPALLKRAGSDETADQLATMALGRINTQPVKELVAQVLADLRAHESPQTVRRLGWLGPAAEPAAPLLLSIFERSDADLDLRTAASYALASIRPSDPGMLQTFVDMLHSNDLVLRHGAAFIVGWYGAAAADAVPSLVRLLEDRDARIPALISLGGIGPAATAALPALERARSWGKEHAAQAIRRVLGEYAGRDAGGHLR